MTKARCLFLLCHSTELRSIQSANRRQSHRCALKFPCEKATNDISTCSCVHNSSPSPFPLLCRCTHYDPDEKIQIVRQDEQEGQAAIELTGGDTSTIEESVSSLSSSDDEVQDGESSAQQSSDPSSEVGTGENRRFLRHSDEPLSSAENSPHRLLTNNNEHGDAMVTETLPAEYSSGEPSRHFPGVSDLREQNPKRDTTASEARRHLEEIASAGMAAAHAQDLDLRAKDDDIHILNVRQCVVLVATRGQ